eukprot:TRINITY_DN18349_c0_g3_i1.p1 TRINITY_DN18349_c0_g3~~TRINITY_DN18349_c0_g3_i1.p1  ORF type:complete len:264 (+),score=81.56 TRINITY_DN18349_c0_g3_i1:75-794(+)
MRLYNSDLDEAERVRAASPEGCGDSDEDGADGEPCRSFFELRQRTLVGMVQVPAFRIVVLGLLRKLRMNTRGSVLYGEVEDALGRYFRLLDGDMQRFATLHETLREAADRQAAVLESGTSAASAGAATAQQLLHDGMREIAVVLLACGKMQKRALDLKMAAQRSIAETPTGPAAVSFSRFADFLEEALAICDQLRRKHEELQSQRMKAMAVSAGARASTGQAAVPTAETAGGYPGGAVG